MYKQILKEYENNTKIIVIYNNLGDLVGPGWFTMTSALKVRIIIFIFHFYSAIKWSLLRTYVITFNALLLLFMGQVSLWMFALRLVMMKHGWSSPDNLQIKPVISRTNHRQIKSYQ